MNQSSRRAPLALAALSLSLSLSACGRVPGQFEILNDQIPAAAAGGGCMVPVAPTIYQGVGRLDLAIASSNSSNATSAYLFFPLLENNFPAKTGQIDSNQIQMTGFNIDITPLASTTPGTNTVLAGNTLAHFRTAWSGSIMSGGGQLSAIVDAFPVALANQLLTSGGVSGDPTATLNLHVQAIGTTVGGTDVQSDPFDFPLEICVGCLVANLQPCPYSAAPTNTGNVCNVAQDDPVDCCLNGDDGQLACPAVTSK